MSTWISDCPRWPALAFAICLSLAGCLGKGAGGERGFFSQADGGAPLRQVALYDGAVVVAGPAGYCLDKQGIKRGPRGEIVVIASCESLSGKAGRAVDPAIMTVSVLPRRLSSSRPTAKDIAATMAPASILARHEGAEISLVQLSDGGDQLLAGGDPRHWRGGLRINGHVVGLAVYGPEGSAAAGADGRQMILSLADRLRQLNPRPES